MAGLKLTAPLESAGFLDRCCKNVTRSGAARLDMYQLVSTIDFKSARAQAEAPLPEAAAVRGPASGILTTCRGSHGT